MDAARRIAHRVGRIAAAGGSDPLATFASRGADSASGGATEATARDLNAFPPPVRGEATVSFGRVLLGSRAAAGRHPDPDQPSTWSWLLAARGGAR